MNLGSVLKRAYGKGKYLTLNEPERRALDLIQWHYEVARRPGVQKGAYLEFGCFKGNSTIAFQKAAEIYFGGSVPEGELPMFLFDSFVGLPASSDPKDQHESWKAGTFDVGGVDQFRASMRKRGLPDSRYVCIPGYYEDSLPKTQLPKGTKAGIVNMDCDYYSSTVAALDFLKPYFQNGTLIYFDDLLSFFGNPKKGQIAAIDEFNRANPDMGISPCPLLEGKYAGRIYWVWVA